LDTYDATARLSIWLMMKKTFTENNSRVLKTKLNDWLKCARSETGKLVAMEIVQQIGRRTEYISICHEIFKKSDLVLNARVYIRDPIAAV